MFLRSKWFTPLQFTPLFLTTLTGKIPYFINNIRVLVPHLFLNLGIHLYFFSFLFFQIDVVSLYLIFLVQIITSGLQVIYTQDEVAFMQNLVYYVERAYRTPDYGIWERGSKYNDGSPEIHAR